jgi:acyl-CoA thioesterase
VDARAFLGLEATHNPHRWYLPVVPGVSTGHGFLFGGCGLGAAVAALEGATGRPLVWATAQYLSYARPPSILDIDVTVASAGHRTTQARAVGKVGDTEILTVNAALGSRDLDAQGEWVTMPDVPPPHDCPERQMRTPDTESINSRLETRMALGRDHSALDGSPGTGRSALWARLPDVLEVSAASLAILGDFVPFGISQALGSIGGGNSLDNTIRIARLVPTEWVLLDIRVLAVANGFGNGAVLLWAEDGTLLATASQSTIVRLVPREEAEEAQRRVLAARAAPELA